MYCGVSLACESASVFLVSIWKTVKQVRGRHCQDGEESSSTLEKMKIQVHNKDHDSAWCWLKMIEFEMIEFSLYWWVSLWLKMRLSSVVINVLNLKMHVYWNTVN